MGKQVEFFMTEADEAEFVRFASGLCRLRLLRNDFATRSDMFLLALSAEERSVFLSCEEFMDRVRTNYVAEQNRHFIEFMDSEVVQFRRSELMPDGLHLKAGRLWFDPKAADGPKSPAFTVWAGKLLQYIKKNYARSEQERYVGTDAVRRRDAGEIRLGPPAAGLSREEALRKLGLS